MTRHLGTRALTIVIKNSDCSVIRLLQPRAIQGMIKRLKVGENNSDHLLKIDKPIDARELVKTGVKPIVLDDNHIWITSSSCTSCKVLSKSQCIPDWIAYLDGVGLLVRVVVAGPISGRQIVSEMRNRGLRVEVLENREYEGEVRLTDKQVAVLNVALQLGFFDAPRRADLSQIAANLGLTTSTVSRHLRAALKKLAQHYISSRNIV
ncbi:MAG: helix-turn-helix domain-containing protein [Aigarchaeota archaeon]|nr:helix-turn-helix domain-containing protein [Candidatus Pelearchaeum maunauluense]